MKKSNFCKVLFGLTVGVIPFLTGCSARELEDRRFPLALEASVQGRQLAVACAWPRDDYGQDTDEDTGSGAEGEKKGLDNRRITAVTADSVEDALRKVQELQDRYVDYSQIKAVLLQPEVKRNKTYYQQLMRWLEESPEIARNILVFETDRMTLEEVQEQSQGQPGIYLEHLYKNNETYRDTAKTLQEMLYG